MDANDLSLEQRWEDLPPDDDDGGPDPTGYAKEGFEPDLPTEGDGPDPR